MSAPPKSSPPLSPSLQEKPHSGPPAIPAQGPSIASEAASLPRQSGARSQASPPLPETVILPRTEAKERELSGSLKSPPELAVGGGAALAAWRASRASGTSPAAPQPQPDGPRTAAEALRRAREAAERAKLPAPSKQVAPTPAASRLPTEAAPAAVTSSTERASPPSPVTASSIEVAPSPAPVSAKSVESASPPSPGRPLPAAADTARRTQPQEPGPTEPAARPRRGIAGWLVAAAAILAAVGGFAAWLSVRSDLGTERNAHANTLVTVGTLRADNAALQHRIAGLEVDRAQLAEEARAKAEALAAMEATQDELQHRLQAEVTKGSVLISQQHGELVVDLIDQVVFDSGEAELNEQGKAVLRQVGETLARVPDKVIQVSGHTDALPIAGKLKEEFPTNWELSTARATHVVRYLQEEVKVPANRLVVAGLAETRPIARNTTRSGRSKNRRIEVRLLPMPGK